MTKKSKDWTPEERLENQEYQRAYYAKNSEREKKRKREYTRLHPEARKRINRSQYVKNLEARRQYQREYYSRNKERIKLRTTEYTKKNWDSILPRILDRQKARRKSDLNFRILCNLRGRIWSALRRKTNKSKRTMELIGCPIPDFLIYLESKWSSNMSWDNYGLGKGKWSIDHIIPCDLFDMTNPKHQRICFHFSNLQPMWFVENSAKNNRYNGELPAELKR